MNTSAAALCRILRQPLLLILTALSCLASVLVSTAAPATATATDGMRLLRQAGSNHCLGTSGPESPLPARLVVCNPADPAQIWWRTQRSDGTVTYRLADGRCLDNYTGSYANGNPLVAWKCNGGSAQAWIESPDNSQKVNVKTGKCIDSAYAGIAVGTRIVQGWCTGSATQRWLPIRLPLFSGQIKQASTQQCVAYIAFTSCDGGADTTFSYNFQPEWGQFTNEWGCLSARPGADRIAWADTCDDGPLQHWSLSPHPSGSGLSISINIEGRQWCLDGELYDGNNWMVTAACTTSMSQSFMF